MDKKIKKAIYVFGLLLLFIIAVYFVYQKPINEERTLSQYFAERITTLAAEDIGQAIEGYDNNLLIIAFPGLIDTDFAGVQTFEGRYELSDNKIIFKRSFQVPVSSAERTVSELGYETLLNNLSTRLAVEVVDEASIERIIERINTAERLKTKIGQGGSALGVKIVPLEVLEDSRCPVDVVCVQAGTVRVRAMVTNGDGEKEEIIELNKILTTREDDITLVDVGPEARSEETIEPADYIFYFRVEKKI